MLKVRFLILQKCGFCHQKITYIKGNNIHMLNKLQMSVILNCYIYTDFFY